MQHFTSFTTVPAAARKAAALAAYDAAILSPAGADWQTVAHMLRATIPAGRESSSPRWWADWKLGRVYTLDSLLVRFADDVVVRVNIAKAPGKLPRIASACRAAIGFYRAKTRCADVPAFAYLEDLASGASFDPEACSSLTADIRRADDPAAAVQARATIEAVERMAREVERRRAGLARVERGDNAFTTADASAWRAAYRAGVEELELMRATLALVDPTPAADRAPVPATIQAAEINTPPGEAIAAPYPVMEIGAGGCKATACENAADLTTGQTAKTGADYSDPIPEGGVEIARSALETLGPQGVEVVFNTPCPAPSKTHTITAVCSSHSGRERLLAKVQDGCFPAPRREYHGAYMVTLQDAQEIGEIRGVRFVGMPRRPRSKAAEPLAVSNVVQMPERDNRPLAADLSEAA